MVVLPLPATVNKEVPVDEATVKTFKVGEVEVPSTARVAVGEEEPMPTVWAEVTARMEMPVEEATLKMVLVEPAVPWRFTETVEEVALKPKAVPSNRSLEEEVRVLAAVK